MVSEIKTCIISSRVSKSTKRKLKEIKRQYGYTTGNLLEMNAKNLIMTNNQEALYSLNTVENELELLNNQKSNLSNMLISLTNSIENKTRKREFFKSQLEDDIYGIDQSLINAANSFINARERRDRRYNLYGEIPDITEEELLSKIAYKNNVSSKLLERVIMKLSSHNPSIVALVDEVLNEERNNFI